MPVVMMVFSDHIKNAVLRKQTLTERKFWCNRGRDKFDWCNSTKIVINCVYTSSTKTVIHNLSTVQKCATVFLENLHRRNSIYSLSLLLSQCLISPQVSFPDGVFLCCGNWNLTKDATYMIFDSLSIKGTVPQKATWALNVHFSKKRTMISFIWV